MSRDSKANIIRKRTDRKIRITEPTIATIAALTMQRLQWLSPDRSPGGWMWLTAMTVAHRTQTSRIDARIQLIHLR